MDILLHETLLTLLTLFLCILVFIRSVLYRLRYTQLKLQLSETRENLDSTEKSLKTIQAKYDNNLEFQKSLKEAELTTRLQQPRLASQQQKEKVTAPERYQYVRSLAMKGMGAEEIASTLSISSHEAEQLVNLSKLAQMP